MTLRHRVLLVLLLISTVGSAMAAQARSGAVIDTFCCDFPAHRIAGGNFDFACASPALYLILVGLIGIFGV